MKLLKQILAIILLIIIVSQLYCAIMHIGLAKITLNVVDDQGNPVEGAQVTTGGGLNYLLQRVFLNTDKNGVYHIWYRSVSIDSSVSVRKIGYYHSGMVHVFHNYQFGVWLPWNSKIKIVLRKIIRPIPMYVRNVHIEVPDNGKDIGYDLLKSKWVYPYDEGEHADIVFRVDEKFKNRDDYHEKLTLKFVGPYEGIQIFKENKSKIENPLSDYRLPRFAPENGYQKEFTKLVTQSLGDNRVDNNYIFRVRSIVDKDGKLVRAVYGKIVGDIEFFPLTARPRITMRYYLNPDYTRNLEFDPKRNLFTDLREDEKLGPFKP
jgi:hypothetical protein